MPGAPALVVLVVAWKAGEAWLNEGSSEVRLTAEEEEEAGAALALALVAAAAGIAAGMSVLLLASTDDMCAVDTSCGTICLGTVVPS